MSMSRASFTILFFLSLFLTAGCTSQKASSGAPPAAAEVDGTKITARTAGRYFEVYADKQWRQLIVKGVNIGTALPGRWFTEFPANKRIYQEWFTQIAAMNANTVRVYTLMDPAFYEALDEFNRRPAGPKLWLLQEIWPDEEVPGGNLFHQGYMEGYQREISLDIDALHGRADVPERRGRAWGKYRADVSPYLLGVLIGRELLPEEVSGTNEANQGKNDFAGRYVRAFSASPAEVWLASMCDFAVSYSQEKYRWQMPVAFVSWPTLDPMVHPTEFTPGDAKDKLFNDSETLHPAHLAAAPEAKAGFFAAYHIYPNYPDFIYREPLYAEYRDEQGILRYGGYLRQFMAVHPPYPALVGEFGMSTSLNTAHLHPEGFHHGGVSEIQQGEMIARMMKAIIKEGYAGGLIFEWADEWAKKTWTTEPFMVPYERHVYWRNAMDPEQNYGILACESPYSPLSGGEVLLWQTAGERQGDGDKADGQESKAGQRATPGAGGQSAGSNGRIAALYADADTAYLYLAVEFAGADGVALKPGATEGLVLSLGIDSFGGQSGSARLPVEGLPALPGGAEFLLQINGAGGARLLARPDYNRAVPRFAAAYGDDGVFMPVRALVNRRQLSRSDGTVYPELYADESVLHYGAFDPAGARYDSLAHWYVDDSGRKVYIRLPWLLLNVSDPSSHRVLHDDRPLSPPVDRNKVLVKKTEGFLFYAATSRAGALLDFQPAAGEAFRTDIKTYLWSGWENPSYRTRLKQSYAKVSEVFGAIR